MRIKLIFEKNKRLSSLTTLKVGGVARYFVCVKTVEDFKEAFQECKKRHLPYFILGKGSNTLFDDSGFSGLVILNCIGGKSFVDGICTVGAGYSFALLGVQTARLGCAGLEFACGIPASVGGAVFMNAGANGSEVSDCLVSVDYLTEDGQLLNFKKQDLLFSYRSSSFHQMKGGIVRATFSLTNSKDARKKQLELLSYRKKTQPYREASAGCAFRNPEGNSAGKLIDLCGLKGHCIGGAQVSYLHGNFIINKGGATSCDVQALLAFVQKRVKEKTGILLEKEVRYIQNIEGGV